MPMRPWSGWIRVSPMAMPQLPWMDGMSQRSLQQADGKTWMWGKPSWAELGKWIGGMCRGLMTETLWIVSRSRRGNVQPASCVFWLLTVFSCWKFLTIRASPKKSHVGTWLRLAGIWLYLQILPCIPRFLFVFAHVLPPKFFQISRAAPRDLEKPHLVDFFQASNDSTEMANLSDAAGGNLRSLEVLPCFWGEEFSNFWPTKSPIMSLGPRALLPYWIQVITDGLEHQEPWRAALPFPWLSHQAFTPSIFNQFGLEQSRFVHILGKGSLEFWNESGDMDIGWICTYVLQKFYICLPLCGLVFKALPTKVQF